MTLIGPRETLLRLTRRSLRRGGSIEVPEALLAYFHDDDSWGHAARALGWLAAGRPRRAACHVRLGLNAGPPRPLRMALLSVGVESARRAGLRRRERHWEDQRRAAVGWSRLPALGGRGRAVLATVAPALGGTEGWFGSDAVARVLLPSPPAAAAASRDGAWLDVFAPARRSSGPRGSRPQAGGSRGDADAGSGVTLHLVTDPYLGEFLSAPVGFAVKVAGDGQEPLARLWLRLPPATFPSAFPEATTWRVRLADASRAWDFRPDDGTLRELVWDGQEVRVLLAVPAEWEERGPNPAMLFGAVHDVVIVPGAPPSAS